VILLPLSLASWLADNFQATLKAELKSLPTGSLPLQWGTEQAGLVDDSDIAVTVIRSSATAEEILVLTGIFFSEIVSGCSCGDEPTITVNAYVELQLMIDKSSAEMRCEMA